VNIAEETGLTRTLFVRLQQGGIPTILLRTQYRMHPMLSKVPSQLFYEVSSMIGICDFKQNCRA
jgi:superfamily I DNA and/or RNA helicase